MKRGRHLVTFVGPLLITSVLSSCTAGGCDPQRLTPVEETAAGIDRATSCSPTVEVNEIEYTQWGCAVRRLLLGRVVARGHDYTARAIRGVPTGAGLALSLTYARGRCSGGWLFWVDLELIDRDPDAADDLVRQVSRTGSLD